MIKKLAADFAPSHYSLTFDINESQKTFTGSVHIDGELLRNQPSITLHAKDLAIHDAAIDEHVAKYQVQPKNNELILTLKQRLQAGTHRVRVNFSGKITDDMVGIYPCYFEKNAKKQWLIATQFESHYARQAFPCIDEPAAKATFDLKLITDPAYPAIANTEPQKQTIENGRKVTIFKTTPKMSTYLLAFVTGDMHCTSTKTQDGVTVRSWASTAQPAELLEYSLAEAVKIIEFYNHYFGVPYPLEKCDQVALPDFDAGAMENWGLITYRETALLADPHNPSLSSEQYISLVIAHEISHQWFGNLVTMKWWDDLWLNESFASLMEYIAVDALHPEWRFWEQYASSDMIAASNRDVYSDVQPVRIDVHDPAEISSLFDGAIVYAKGGRLLKMLREYIGESAFRRGLKNYFKKYAYQNTGRDDLWTVLSQASHLDVADFMNAWLEQSGQPILKIQQSKDTVTLSQHRLLLDDVKDTKTSNQLWPIPLSCSDPNFPHKLLARKQEDVAYHSAQPLFFNSTGSGHYVTQYAEGSTQTIALQNDSLSAVARISTFNNALLLAKTGETSLVEVLELVVANQKEDRSAVWELMATALGNARTLIEGDKKTENNLRSVIYQLVAPHYERLDWQFTPEADPNQEHLRRLIIGLAVGSKNSAVTKQALQQYRHAAKPEALPAEYRSMLMGVAVRFGDHADIDTLLALNRQTNSADIRDDIAAALTTTEDPKVIAQLLAILKDSKQVRSQDLIRWYAYLLRNQQSRKHMWQWTQENWSWLMSVFAASKSYDYLPRYAANCMNTAFWLEEYQRFFTPMLNDPALERTIKIGMTEIKARVAWRDRDEKKLQAWLQSRTKLSTSFT